MSTLKISELKGQVAGLPVLIKKVKKMPFAQKEGHFYVLDVCNKNGATEAKMWETKDFPTLSEDCEKNDGLYAYIFGEASEYKGKQQITIANLRIMSDEEVNFADFLPVVEKDREVMFSKILGLVKKVEDAEMKNLLIAVFSDEMIRREYIECIAALKHHHNYLGGLLEHSLQVGMGVLHFHACSDLFPETNLSLMIAGALLHDIGKIEEYVYSKRFDMNPVGVDHKYAAMSLLDMIVFKNNIVIAPEKLAAIKRIIITHHGEFGEFKPETPEEIIVHHCDCISAHANKYLKDKDLLYKPCEN